MRYVIFLISFFTYAVYANENCKSIKDSDKKNYCLATQTKQKSFCYTIADTELKNVCMAQLKQEKYYCYKILSDEVQKECLKLVKWILKWKSLSFQLRLGPNSVGSTLTLTAWVRVVLWKDVTLARHTSICNMMQFD